MGDVTWNRGAHFCAIQSCKWGRTTLLPGACVVVSSVGDYHPEGSPGVPQPIGHDRTYETMVFRWSGRLCRIDGCDCGRPIITDFSELDFAPAKSQEEATANHARMVRKWTTSRDMHRDMHAPGPCTTKEKTPDESGV